MGYMVTVNKNNIVLPNGQVYQSGNSAYLSDTQYSLLSASVIANDISTTSYKSAYQGNY